MKSGHSYPNTYPNTFGGNKEISARMIEFALAIRLQPVYGNAFNESGTAKMSPPFLA